ncbi:hypothetical protein PY793_13845 [Acetobacter fabarum]|uniref:hypothetical protein n=1 Tax=Acetobacter fabarum TaxID=483199 RepID=UPI00312B4194
MPIAITAARISDWKEISWSRISISAIMFDVPPSIYSTIGKNVTYFKQKTFLLPLCAVFLHIPDLASASPRQENDGWEIYANVRFQYQICYPSRLLKPQGESDNSDGQRFLASDGGDLTVFGGYNDVLHWTLEYTLKTYSADLVGQKGKITYQVIKKDWAVFSGDDGERTEFYGKIFIRNDQFYIFELTYKKEYKNKYSKIVERISKCFTTGI